MQLEAADGEPVLPVLQNICIAVFAAVFALLHYRITAWLHALTHS
jgi:uncharacterized protein (DUF983 family)